MALVDAYDCSDCPPSTHTFYANAEEVDTAIPVGNKGLREIGKSPSGKSLWRCVTINRENTIEVDESLCVPLQDSETETCPKCQERWED